MSSSGRSAPSGLHALLGHRPAAGLSTVGLLDFAPLVRQFVTCIGCARAVQPGLWARHGMALQRRVYRNHSLDSVRWHQYEPRADDLVVASSYKSGTTWVQTIVLKL